MSNTRNTRGMIEISAVIIGTVISVGAAFSWAGSVMANLDNMQKSQASITSQLTSINDNIKSLNENLTNFKIEKNSEISALKAEDKILHFKMASITEKQ